MSDYNGWSNRATWAMALDLGNDEYTYRAVESLASYAAIGNGYGDLHYDGDGEEVGRDLTARTEDFHAELARSIEAFARGNAASLPDFDPAMHKSPNPKDSNGPDDIDDVDWQEIAENYPLDDYL